MGVKKSIDDMNLLAESKEFKCLSTVYINISTPLKWKCSEGHIWEARPNNIKNGSWCPECSGLKSTPYLISKWYLHRTKLFYYKGDGMQIFTKEWVN